MGSKSTGLLNSQKPHREALELAMKHPLLNSSQEPLAVGQDGLGGLTSGGQSTVSAGKSAKPKRHEHLESCFQACGLLAGVLQKWLA